MKKIQEMYKKILAWAVQHRVWAGVIILAILYSGYLAYGKLTATPAETRYVTAIVTKGTVISSITGSGQVAAGNQVDLKPKASGDIVYVGVTSGQEVKAGTLIAQLDATDAQKAVRDAEISLESAKISLQKLEQPADALSVTQSENTLARAKESKQNAETDLIRAYDEGYNTVSNAFLDLPAVMAGLQDTLFTATQSLGGTEQNMDFYAHSVERFDARAESYRTDVYNKYHSARTRYDGAFNAYKTLDRSASKADIEAVITDAYETTKLIADAVKSSNNLIQFYKDQMTLHSLPTKALADTHLTTLSGYTAKTNTHLSSLLNVATTIQGDKDAIVNANRTITEQEGSLANLKDGADVLDLASSRLSVTQRENALLDAKAQFADYFVRAPFTGTIAKLNNRKGDTVSSGAVVAVLITKEKIAEIALNEVDVAKVKVGLKSTLTFDAVEGLTITGKVAEVDTVGTVSQGVVTYTVKIAFDTGDDRVKPGMSTSATIITEVKQDVLTVPNSAVKMKNEAQSVEMFETPLEGSANPQGALSTQLPVSRIIVTGITSNEATEVISGLTEGEQVIVKTITSSATGATAKSATSLLGGGSGMRMPR